MQEGAQNEGCAYCSEGWCMETYSEQSFWRQWNSWRAQSKLYEDHYSTNMLEARKQMIGTIRCILTILESGEPTLYINLELSKKWIVKYSKWISTLYPSSMYHFQTGRLSPYRGTSSTRWFAQKLNLCRTGVLQSLTGISIEWSPSDQVYSWSNNNDSTFLKSLIYLDRWVIKWNCVTVLT